MGIELQQGANAAITDQTISIGITWTTSVDFDADASAFLIGTNGKVRTNQDFIFYNQTTSLCGGLLLDTASDKNQRAFRAELQYIPTDIEKLIFTVTIATRADATGCPHCGMMNNLSISIINSADVELIRFTPKNIDKERALILGELYRHQGGWKFRAVGQGYHGGLDILAASFGVDVQNHNANANAVEIKTRLPSKQAWTKRAIKLQQELRVFLPQINDAVASGANESTTRMILDRILVDVLGYAMSEVKAEQKIQGRKADYVLAADGADLIVGESKRAGLTLRERHVFQATSYGAYSGICWALLTNLTTWQLYHISTQNIVNTTLLFSVDLLPDVRLEDCERLLLISRFGITQKGMLEKYWRDMNALTRDSLTQAILSEDVVKAVRLVVRRNTGCVFDNNLIQQSLLNMFIQT